MFFLEAMDCQKTKHLVPGGGCLPSSCCWEVSWRTLSSSQAVYRLSSLLLVVHQYLILRSYCWKHHVLVSGRRKINLVLTKNLPPSWLAVTGMYSGPRGTVGRVVISVLPNCKLYKIQWWLMWQDIHMDTAMAHMLQSWLDLRPGSLVLYKLSRTHG